VFENLEEKENKFGRRAKNIQKQTSSNTTNLEVEDNTCAEREAEVTSEN
jgi:23S rRNA maturation mini-RNase III